MLGRVHIWIFCDFYVLDFSLSANFLLKAIHSMILYFSLHNVYHISIGAIARMRSKMDTHRKKSCSQRSEWWTMANFFNMRNAWKTVPGSYIIKYRTNVLLKGWICSDQNGYYIVYTIISSIHMISAFKR